MPWGMQPTIILLNQAKIPPRFLLTIDFKPIKWWEHKPSRAKFAEETEVLSSEFILLSSHHLTTEWLHQRHEGIMATLVQKSDVSGPGKSELLKARNVMCKVFMIPIIFKDHNLGCMNTYKKVSSSLFSISFPCFSRASFSMWALWEETPTLIKGH